MGQENPYANDSNELVAYDKRRSPTRMQMVGIIGSVVCPTLSLIVDHGGLWLLVLLNTVPVIVTTISFTKGRRATGCAVSCALVISSLVFSTIAWALLFGLDVQ